MNVLGVPDGFILKPLVFFTLPSFFMEFILELVNALLYGGTNVFKFLVMRR